MTSSWNPALPYDGLPALPPEEVAVGREKLFVHSKLMSLLQDEANDLVPYE